MDQIDSRTDQSFWSQWKKASIAGPGFRVWELLGNIVMRCEFCRHVLIPEEFIPGGYLDWYLEDEYGNTLGLDEVEALELLRHV